MKQNTVLFSFHFLQFCKKVFENLHLENDYFKTIFGHFSAKYIYVFDKNEDLIVILRCLVCLILNWVKSYDIILVKIFFFLPENALFQGLFERASFDTSELNQLSYFQNGLYRDVIYLILKLLACQILNMK